MLDSADPVDAFNRTRLIDYSTYRRKSPSQIQSANVKYGLRSYCSRFFPRCIRQNRISCDSHLFLFSDCHVNRRHRKSHKSNRWPDDSVMDPSKGSSHLPAGAGMGIGLCATSWVRCVPGRAWKIGVRIMAIKPIFWKNSFCSDELTSTGNHCYWINSGEDQQPPCSNPPWQEWRESKARIFCNPPLSNHISESAGTKRREPPNKVESWCFQIRWKILVRCTSP